MEGEGWLLIIPSDTVFYFTSLLLFEAMEPEIIQSFQFRKLKQCKKSLNRKTLVALSCNRTRMWDISTSRVMFDMCVGGDIMCVGRYLIFLIYFMWQKQICLQQIIAPLSAHWYKFFERTCSKIFFSYYSNAFCIFRKYSSRNCVRCYI